VEERESRAQAASNGLSTGAYSNYSSNAFYGWSDLWYFGNWSYMPGFGYGWIPDVSAGWYPYSLGLWCWYPGFGYTWIPFDPWGWLPYHYGGWQFIPGIGWVWFPGSFGAWSPALVTWYGGPGWIGWMPRPGLPNRPRINACPQGQSCGTAISTNAFQSGRPVDRRTILSVNVESGRRMERPDVLPERQAMLPGRIVAPPAGLANIRPISNGMRGAALSAKTINAPPSTPAPGAVAGSSRALGRSAVGSVGRHAAPGPESGIVYDPAAGRYVNNSRQPAGATHAPNELPAHPLPLAPGASVSRAGQPAPRTPQKGGTAPTPQSHGWDSSHYSPPRSGSNSSAAPRSGGATVGGHATGGSGGSGGGSMSGAAGGGGGAIGGGSHAGGGSSSGGGHR
jgi:hypothetical protein